MAPHPQETWSDSDDEGQPDIETSVLLGVPDGAIDVATDLTDAAVSRIGGRPTFLPSREPPITSSHCKVCDRPMELLVQIWCPFEGSPMDRALYIWGCARPGCQKKQGSVRAWRGLRYNEKYAVMLKKKLEQKQDKEKSRAAALLEAEKKKELSKINPFSANAMSTPVIGLGMHIFGSEEARSTIGHDEEDDGEESDESEESLLTAMTKTAISDSPWQSAPEYKPVYLSTVPEYLPPPSKSKLPTGAQVESEEARGDFSWMSEKYENSLEIDPVFERFTRRVAAEGEQCIRYELNGVPLPFASDAVYRKLFPLATSESSPVTKGVMQSAKGTYDPSGVSGCEKCGSKRVFECQLMPNVMNVVERKEDGMEWGTCLVFSCGTDCSSEEWAEEAVVTIVFPMDDAKFPHTRAQLVAIARQYRSIDHVHAPDDARLVPTSLLHKVVSLLIDENGDGLQDLLRDAFAVDDDMLEQHALDLMHKHRDDVAGLPFLFLTPTRRPISRPSSRASTHSHSARLHPPTRPDTPASASAPASPLALVFRRPHTPVASPLAASAIPTNNFLPVRSDYVSSPHSSPVLAHAHATQAHAQFTASLPASPLSSPRLLNARASEFKPIQRPLSAASSNPGSLLRADSPSPDLWGHNSPRTSSNLAIAAPLVADQSSTSGTPSSSLRSSLLPANGEDDDDPFDPFSTKPFPLSFHSLSLSDCDANWEGSDQSRPSEDQTHVMSQSPWSNPFSYHSPKSNDYGLPPMEMVDEAEANSVLTDGMTPFDVLSSVFGSSLAPSELEEALANNAYNFERAMAWLVDKTLPATPQPPPIQIQSMGNRVTLATREAQPALRGGRGAFPVSISPPGRNVQRFASNGRPAQTATRVCRYYLAGECLRADCRFSHELERALCRFWLRGACAKQENCEFMHHLPNDADIAHVNTIIARANGPPGANPLHAVHNPLPEEFPVLGYDNTNRKMKLSNDRFDPSRTRFSAAVKKPAPAPSPNELITAARREAMGPSADNLYHHTAIVAPRSSPRLKLRPPSLLPTLPTGESVNKLYMTYRQRALQLGAARNACLSRAADAWRRGDGAAAKRFSREGHDLNTKMKGEMADAASKLVRERVKVAEQAARSRDMGWSDDPGDRTSRGKTVGGGLGMCLGIASSTTGDGKLTSEERTECVLDLHGLHSNEAIEVLEEFLLALEKEHFLGLAYIIVGEEKHTGTQDVARGSSRMRLATGVREWIHRWGYPWSERDGIICVDPLTHASE
ncbi:hypothetical protein AX15_004299 [Amanita polypyramis BW_CC]|nr:hypothetical protein AX15_004299 [Amanita polypyramis BW_CC]